MGQEPASRQPPLPEHRGGPTLELRKKRLLKPADVRPSSDELDVIGVLNPGVAELDGRVLLLARVAQRPRESRPGYTGLPRYSKGRLIIDWVPDAELEVLDSRVVRVRNTGLVRLTFVSHLQVVRCHGADVVGDVESSVLMPEERWEEFGVEDARITPIDDRFYITYVAVSRHGAATALASTGDFREFRRHGIIFPPENKDVVIFPERIDGRYMALHRPNAATPFTTPEMWTARSDDLTSWGRHLPLFVGRSVWETGRVGAGVPPLRTPAGWLEIYHGNQRPMAAGQVGRYVAAAMLLDADDPSRLIRYAADPLFVPSEPFEREGFVQDVVFPTGAVERGDSLFVYYGASDTYTAVAEMRLGDVLARLLPLPAAEPD
jgi:predicted GH43/DUF377 family glycosyl hydrolase